MSDMDKPLTYKPFQIQAEALTAAVNGACTPTRNEWNGAIKGRATLARQFERRMQVASMLLRTDPLLSARAVRRELMAAKLGLLSEAKIRSIRLPLLPGIGLTATIRGFPLDANGHRVRFHARVRKAGAAMRIAVRVAPKKKPVVHAGGLPAPVRSAAEALRKAMLAADITGLHIAADTGAVDYETATVVRTRRSVAP